MLKLVLVLGLSFGSVLIGYVLRRLVLRRPPESRPDASGALSGAARWIKLTAMALVIPWPIMFTFWRITRISPRYIILPLLGLLSFAVGGAASILMIRLSRLSSEKAGSLFACGMMTNLGIIGGLVGMLFYGNEGYLTVQLFILFEAFIYYLVVFPVSQQIGSGAGAGFRFRPGLILTKPLSLVPLTAILVGLTLRGFKVPAPDILDQISAVLVPSTVGLIGISIGMTLRISRVRFYLRESLMISIIKFAVIPAVIIPLAVVLGLPDLLNGVAFRMVIILSFGPVALTAMVPPQLYGLDLDLANTGWLVTTALNLLIVPILVLLLI